MKNRTLYIILGIIGIISIILIFLYYNSSLTLNVKQSGATITIDSKQFSNKQKVKLKPGEHKVVIELEDYITYRKILNVGYGATRVEEIDLRLLPVAQKITSQKAAFPIISTDEQSMYFLSISDKTMYLLNNIDAEKNTLEKISPDFFTDITDIVWSSDQKLAIIKQDEKTSLYDFQRYNLLNQEITAFEDGIKDIVFSSDSQNILYYYAPENGEKTLVKASKTNTDKEIVYNFLETKIRDPQIDWSNDLANVLLVADRKIYILKMLDKTLTNLNLSEDVLEATFTPDDKILFLTKDGARTCDIDGGSIVERQFNTTLEKISFYTDSQLLLAEKKSDQSYSFYKYNLEDNTKTEIVYNKKTSINPVSQILSPNEKYLFFQSNNYIYRLSVDTLEY